MQVGTATAAPEIVLPQLGILDANISPVRGTVGVEQPDPAVKIARDFGVQSAPNLLGRRDIHTRRPSTRAARPSRVSVNHRLSGPSLNRRVQQETFAQGRVYQHQIGRTDVLTQITNRSRHVLFRLEAPLMELFA